jgi:hypothetical protein
MAKRRVGNRPNSLACKWHVTYRWKALNESYNFALDLISIGGLHRKLCAPKVARVPGQNVIWMLVPWLGTEYTIRGKVVTSPKSGLWWILWVQVRPWLVLAPKVFKLCTNQLVFDFMQVHVSSWGLSFFLVPSRSSSTPLYPQTIVSQGACPDSLFFCSFHFRLTFESIKELGS